MLEVRADVLARLNELGIAYDLIDHPPVFTIEDCQYAEARLNALVPKNLFLAPRNASAFYLLILRPNAAFHTAEISRQIPSSRLSFAGNEHLMRLLRTRSGAISPMGLMFDEGREVRLLIDRSLEKIDRLAFHPCVNTASLALSGSDFFGAFLPAIGREFAWVDIAE